MFEKNTSWWPKRFGREFLCSGTEWLRYHTAAGAWKEEDSISSFTLR